MREFVFPGDKIADTKMVSESTYTGRGGTYASVIGMRDEGGRYIPLELVYRPEIDDYVVGVVVYERASIKGSTFKVDVGMAQEAMFSGRDTRVHFQVGDFVYGKIRDVDEVGVVELTDIRRLEKGKLMEFPSSKIPRVIGKKSSMISMIREKTDTDVCVGNNGFIWISAKGNLPKVVEVLEMIRREAHRSGLTDRVSAFLSGNQ